MTFPGTDAGADRPVDPKLAKALSHPLRRRILERLSTGGEASPKELAGELDARLATVAYHVQILLELGCLELARTRQVRGALEHHYRATAHPWLDPQQWASVTGTFRRQALAGTLRGIVADASEAGAADGFDAPEAVIKRISLRLDIESWRAVAAMLEQMLASQQRLHAPSRSGAGEAPAQGDCFDAELAVLLFRRAPRR